jgi:sterol desaturase/sphingolipid hydroxylase (fatty acid hydroxylase superfamily)
MFRSDLFERLSVVHPAVPHIIFLPLTAWMLAQTTAEQWMTTTMLFGLGLLVWTLTEYVIHRYLFHPPPHIEDDTRRVLRDLKPGEPCFPALPTWRHRFYFIAHGVHHDFPSDTRRLVMPPSVSIPLAVLFFLGFKAALGAYAYATFAGFIVGYLFYDTTHYLTHHGPARSALSRAQRRRHFRHHYADSTHDYGVSSPLWDLVLGTYGRSSTRQP